MSLEGIQFSYRGEEKGRNIEFYTKLLKGFIEKNDGKILWIKGAKVEREAYLIFDTEVHDKCLWFWRQTFNANKFFAMRALSREEISDQMEKCKNGARVFVGSLPEESIKTYEWNLSGADPVVRCPRCGGPCWRSELKCGQCGLGEEPEEPWICPVCEQPANHGTWCDHEGREIKPIEERGGLPEIKVEVHA